MRATYMYSGMADVAALTGDAGLRQGHRHDLGRTSSARSSTSPAASARPARGEAFGRDYELPNMTRLQRDLRRHRQRLLEPPPVPAPRATRKYIDVMERTLYNGLLSGVSLDGKSFFYPNPLESTGQHQRSPWFGVACCPGNMTRFLASVPGYVYAQQGDTLYVNLFVRHRRREAGRRPHGEAGRRRRAIPGTAP